MPDPSQRFATKEECVAYNYGYTESYNRGFNEGYVQGYACAMHHASTRGPPRHPGNYQYRGSRGRGRGGRGRGRGREENDRYHYRREGYREHTPRGGEPNEQSERPAKRPRPDGEHTTSSGQRYVLSGNVRNHGPSGAADADE